MKAAGVVPLLHNITAMSLGYVTAKLFRLNKQNAISVTIESGIQNGILALVITASVLNNPEMGIPIGGYYMWMFITGGILMWHFGKKNE